MKTRKWLIASSTLLNYVIVVSGSTTTSRLKERRQNL